MPTAALKPCSYPGCSCANDCGAAAVIPIGLFRLMRDVDVSGVSGTGVVAHGAVFPNGRAVLSWCVPDLPQSTGVYDSFADLCAIHLHGCCTRVEWIYAEQGKA